MKIKGLQTIVAAIALAWSLGGGGAQAATVVTPGGVTNITVGAEQYNVAFLPSVDVAIIPGVCISGLFPCLTGTANQFPNLQSAVTAANALAQILNQPTNAAYLPAGCTVLVQYCYILTRYGAPTGGDFGFGFQIPLLNLGGSGWVPTAPGSVDPNLAQPGLTYAVWVKSSTVPLPASGLILLAGLGALAMLRRRKTP